MFTPEMMQGMMGNMIGDVMDKAAGMAKKMQFSWHVKEFDTTSELQVFVDGKKLAQVHLTTLGNKLVLMYGVQL